MPEILDYFGLVTLFFTSVSSSSLTCGGKTCSELEYCSADDFCNSCKEICDSSSHNYDNITCANKCSDYKFNILYVKRTEFEDAVKDLHKYMLVSLIVSFAALLLVVIVILTVWLKCQRMKYSTNNNDKKIKKKMETIKAICVNEVDNSKRMKLNIPAPVTDKDTPPSALTTMTPLSRRHPSEDATLEFAYDNPTLTHSPVFGNTPDTTPKNNRTETTF